MSDVIIVMGEPGSGKTTSLRSLPSEETVYINCDGKSLNWKGWREQYSADKKNYIVTDIPEIVLKTLAVINVSEKYKHVKYVVVDTLNGIMVADERRRSKEKGYDKWVDLAYSVYDIVDGANKYREDLTIILLAHSQTDRDDSGYSFTKLKTSGKKLDKISLESKSNTVLLAKTKGNGKHVFETHARNSTARTPMGAFEEDEIDNDIMLVIKALKDY